MIEDTIDIDDPSVPARFFETVTIPSQEYRGIQIVAIYPNDMPFQHLVDDAFLFFENVSFYLHHNGTKYVLKDDQTVLMKEYRINFTYNAGESFLLEARLPSHVKSFQDVLRIRAILKPKSATVQKHKCTCPMSVVLNRGCQCGGI